MENRLSWITKIEPKLMMEVSLVLSLSLRQLHDGQTTYILILRSQALRIWKEKN